VLKDLKSGSAKEAKKALDSWEEQYGSNSYIMPQDGSRSAVAKVRLLNLWMLRSSSREQEWKEMPKAANRRPIYDVDTRWNSALDMIEQFLELEEEYKAFVESHPQVHCLCLNNSEVVALHQLAHVLRPFKAHTLTVSKTMPSVARSLEIYWDLDDLLEQVISGQGDYAELDQTIRNAFTVAKAKHVKYYKKLDKNALIYAAHILDPRCKTSMIKDIMLDKAEQVLTAVRKYFKSEWPELAKDDVSSLSPQSLTSNNRPDGVSLAQWKAIQHKRVKEAEVGAAQPTSKLERWLQSEPLEWDTNINNNPNFLQLWWKEHTAQWPLLAKAARDLLPCSALEVDVERLFSGCRDKFGIR
jgi:hypothetical protein